MIEITAQYRQAKTTQGKPLGRFPITMENKPEQFKKDAFYKLTIEFVKEGDAPKQGRPKPIPIADVPTPNSETTTKPSDTPPAPSTNPSV